MTKAVKITVLSLSFLTIVGAFIYFVSGISSLYPPIATYSYSGRVDSLISNIQEYGNNNPSITFKVTDTVGTTAETYAFYVDFGLKKTDRVIIYDLKFEPIDGSDRTKGTLIHLVGAHDLIGKIGGYRINDPGVQDMLNYFESEFLIELKREAKINIVRNSK